MSSLVSIKPFSAIFGFLKFSKAQTFLAVCDLFIFTTTILNIVTTHLSVASFNGVTPREKMNLDTEI